MQHQEWIEFEVINWKKFNPRSDRANYTWFRLENSIATEPKFHDLSASQRFIAICLFAEASKAAGKPARVKVSWLADQLKVKTSEITKTVASLVSDGVLRCLPVSLLPATYERTNETNETNVRDERDETNAATSRDGRHATPDAKIAHPVLSDSSTQVILNEIKREVQDAWCATYPPEWIKHELRKALAWIAANPQRAPKGNPGRFMTNWLARSWEQYRKTLPSNPTHTLAAVPNPELERLKREQEAIDAETAKRQAEIDAEFEEMGRR